MTETEQDYRNRRQDPRYAVAAHRSLKVELHRWLDSGEETVPGELLDLSQGGAKIFVSSCLQFSEAIGMDMTIADDEIKIQVTGEVCWIRPVGEQQWLVGCSFTPKISEQVIGQLAEAGLLERRCHTRRHVQLEGTARWELERDPFPVVIRDYSAGGFCMSSIRPGRVGQGVLIDLNTLGDSQRELTAKVRWQMESGGEYLIGCMMNDDQDYRLLRELGRLAEPDEMTSWRAKLGRPAPKSRRLPTFATWCLACATMLVLSITLSLVWLDEPPDASHSRAELTQVALGDSASVTSVITRQSLVPANSLAHQAENSRRPTPRTTAGHGDAEGIPHGQVSGTAPSPASSTVTAGAAPGRTRVREPSEKGSQDQPGLQNQTAGLGSPRLPGSGQPGLQNQTAGLGSPRLPGSGQPGLQNQTAGLGSPRLPGSGQPGLQVQSAGLGSPRLPASGQPGLQDQSHVSALEMDTVLSEPSGNASPAAVEPSGDPIGSFVREFMGGMASPPAPGEPLPGGARGAPESGSVHATAQQGQAAGRARSADTSTTDAGRPPGAAAAPAQLDTEVSTSATADPRAHPDSQRAGQARRAWTRGSNHYRSGRFAEAAAAFREAAASDPQDPLHLYLLAMSLYRTPPPNDAQQILQQAIVLERFRPIPHWGELLSRYQGPPRLWVERHRSAAQ